MQRRDVGSEVIVALAAIGTLALALTFGVVLTLSRVATPQATTTGPAGTTVANQPGTQAATQKVSGTAAATQAATQAATTAPKTAAATGAATQIGTSEVPQIVTKAPNTAGPAGATRAATTQAATTAANTGAANGAATQAAASAATKVSTKAANGPSQVAVLATKAATNTKVPPTKTKVPPSATRTNTARPTNTPTPIPTNTHTATITNTPTNTLTFTPSKTRTKTSTRTPTKTRTPKPTRTPTRTPRPTNTPTNTPLPTDTPLPPPTACFPRAGWVPYTVLQGDTLFSISRRAGVSLIEMQTANCILDASAIYAGQVIVVPPGSQVSVTAAAVQPTQPNNGFPDVSGDPRFACNLPNARITSPQNGAGLRGIVTVYGKAAIDNFSFYKLELRPYGSANWSNFTTSPSPADGILGTFRAARFQPGVYEIQLTVVDNTSNYPMPCAVLVALTR
jgi:hypothetical protein